MPRSTINFDTVRNIGLTLPGVEESTAYGQRALKVRGRLLACVPANRSAEPGSLAVRVDFDDRAGEYAFYYYGPGGIGVSYPDTYFFNLRGKTLYITFDGPYINDKTPSAETKKLERELLATFRLFGD